MRHVNKRFRKWAIRDMQRHSVGGALHCAKSPQDYSSAKRIGVMYGEGKSQNRLSES